MRRIVIFLCMLAPILAACQAVSPNQTPDVFTQATETILNVAEVEPSSTPEPTPTETPSKIILIYPPDAELEVVDIKKVLEQQAQQAGLLFETFDPNAALEITPGVKGIAVYNLKTDLDSIIQANPDIPFLVVDSPGAQASGNVHVLDFDQNHSDQAGFLAGYLASVITPDWRVGIISTAETTPGKAASLGFTNGVIFYCGLCRPSYPPFVAYPVIANLPVNASDLDFQSAIDSMANAGVTVIYVSDAASDISLYQKLAEDGFLIIGSGAPPAGLESVWVASIQPDQAEALKQLGLGWLTGTGTYGISVPPHFSYANSELFSQGRQQLVKNFQDELHNGYIDTGVDPLTGEPKP